jgi:uncharacterized protein (DUF58 family)
MKPTLRALLLLVLPLVLSAGLWNLIGIWSLTPDAAVILLLLADWFLIRKLPPLKTRLKGPGSYSLGRRGEIRVTLETTRRYEVVRAALPVLEHLETENPQWQATLNSGIPEIHVMNFRPLKRGVYTLDFIDIHRKSPLGFFWFPQTEKTGFSIEVTPDVEAIRTFYHLIRRNRLTDLGYHPLSLTGGGMELHHLREYRLDEDSRHIDWKATTRLGRPVSKIFTAETSNQITFVIDTGRLMTAEDNGISLLDYAVNGTLLLGNIALRMGDQVGIIAVSDKITAELPPVRGIGSQARVRSVLAGLEPRFADTNYRMLFPHLQKVLNKRSLVIFFSDFMGSSREEYFLAQSSHLSARHFVLFLMLRDKGLESLVDSELRGEEQRGYTRTSAREIRNLREEAMTRLQNSGIHVADILPEQVNTTLVNRYLAIRSSNRL